MILLVESRGYYIGLLQKLKYFVKELNESEYFLVLCISYKTEITLQPTDMRVTFKTTAFQTR